MSENVVVSADWLGERLDEVRVIDVRDAWEFDGIGHIPGAVNVPFDSFRSPEGDEGMLPGVETWEELLSEAGVERDGHLVAYDDTHGVFAARFLVTAELYGHPPERLHLLDGDYSSWNRRGETTSDETEIEATTYATREPESTPLVGYDFVFDALDDGESVVVDTRETWEYEEGHLPGAVNLDWRELVDEETRGLKPREELESILASNGVERESRVVLYCNTARRISHTYTVLRYLGYENVAFYEGSLTEWEERDGPLVGADG
ncbi:thiosulfate/3-mercaptopyruvate sulfurtransferase [Halopelagius inordinatus]|uniref:Thiosulfate/3-mercaptopyruvate sulfurtransferase n=1 Tax=Halopelagius inordinatus TaxID=553467 RepID=A0A1I2LAS5_9EURY|nr:sulfurtransferase [Halopelagius inordinatus]SFF75559.1 thiosulfate/3-mercaptopyruvate sulfurtransferase [Halopelagius inordinatus]